MTTTAYVAEHGHGKYDWYFPFYDAALRDLKVTRLLEIGCSELSLTTWRDCFPGAEIVGLDLNPRGPTNQEDLPGVAGVTFIEGDQEHEDLLRSLGSFDVVFDDGGHHDYQNIKSFQTLFPAMNPGGWYFIEDLHCSYDGAYHGSTVNFLKTLVDDLHARYLGGRQRWPISELRFCDSLVGIRRA